MEYPIEHFYGYAEDVFLEMRKRGFKCNFNKFNQYFKGWIDRSDVKEEELFANWHNDRYLYQCVFNLQEKFDCGGISGEEMVKISHYMTEKEIEKMDEFANIMRMERASTGNYGADVDDTERFCPICGQASPDYVYEDKGGDIIGCTECLTKKDIYNDYNDEQWERKC